MPHCAVHGCSNSNRNTKGSGIKFYTFPKDYGLQKKWLTACSTKYALNLRTATVCSEHFSVDCFMVPLKYRLLQCDVPKTHRNLTPGAVPSLKLPRTIPQDSHCRIESSVKCEKQNITVIRKGKCSIVKRYKSKTDIEQNLKVYNSSPSSEETNTSVKAVEINKHINVINTTVAGNIEKQMKNVTPGVILLLEQPNMIQQYLPTRKHFALQNEKNQNFLFILKENYGCVKKCENVTGIEGNSEKNISLPLPPKETYTPGEAVKQNKHIKVTASMDEKEKQIRHMTPSVVQEYSASRKRVVRRQRKQNFSIILKENYDSMKECEKDTNFKEDIPVPLFTEETCISGESIKQNKHLTNFVSTEEKEKLVKNLTPSVNSSLKQPCVVQQCSTSRKHLAAQYDNKQSSSLIQEENLDCSSDCEHEVDTGGNLEEDTKCVSTQTKDSFREVLEQNHHLKASNADLMKVIKKLEKEKAALLKQLSVVKKKRKVVKRKKRI